jgi:hypothetical protein
MAAKTHRGRHYFCDRSQALREKSNDEKSEGKPTVPAGYALILPTATVGLETTIKHEASPDEERMEQTLQTRDVSV